MSNYFVVSYQYSYSDIIFIGHYLSNKATALSDEVNVRLNDAKKCLIKILVVWFNKVIIALKIKEQQIIKNVYYRIINWFTIKYYYYFWSCSIYLKLEGHCLRFAISSIPT